MNIGVVKSYGRVCELVGLFPSLSLCEDLHADFLADFPACCFGAEREELLWM